LVKTEERNNNVAKKHTLVPVIEELSSPSGETLPAKGSVGVSEGAMLSHQLAIL
jgi:hypothetical protein